MKALLLFLSAVGLYGQVVVIGPASLPMDRLTLSEIQHLYMGKTATIRGVDLTPKDNGEGTLFKEFCQEVLGKSTHQIRAYWSRMIFTGQKSPPPQTTTARLKEERTLRPPVITYVRPGQVLEGWKILYEAEPAP